MEIPKHIVESVKNSIGYSETTNKESFMIGANVAFKRAEEFYASTIKSLSVQLAGMKASCDSVTTDMKTIVDIIEKYNYLTKQP